MKDLPGVDQAVLESYLQSRGLIDDGGMSIRLVSGGRSNLTFEVTDRTRRYIVRRPPTAGLTPSAHDMVREWTVAKSLQDTAVPVAGTVDLCEDLAVMGAPFTVVDFVDGLVVRSRDDLALLSDNTLSRSVSTLVRHLVDLHAIDHREVGLAGFGRPEGFVQRQIGLWRRQWTQVRTRELPDLERLHSLLLEGQPTSPGPAIIHGDYRIDNTILDSSDPDAVLAIIDWELSTVGDPLTDVALMCAYRHPRFDDILGQPAAWTSDRLPSASEIAAEYAFVSGRDISDWPFYLGLAYFKLAVIGEGIAHRALQGFDAGGRGALAAQATPELISAGLRAVSPSAVVDG